MRKFAMKLAFAFVLISSIAASVLYAQEPQGPAQRPDGSTMGTDMQRMMNTMMGEKNQMMAMCGKMMQAMMQGGTQSPPGLTKPGTK